MHTEQSTICDIRCLRMTTVPLNMHVSSFKFEYACKGKRHNMIDRLYVDISLGLTRVHAHNEMICVKVVKAGKTYITIIFDGKNESAPVTH